MIPNPLEDWYKDKDKQTRLDAIMNDPVMKEAMALLVTIKLPIGEGGQGPFSEEIGNSALEHHRNKGFFTYPIELWNLTKLPKQPDQGMPEPYSDSHVTQHAIKMGWFQEFTKPEEPAQS